MLGLCPTGAVLESGRGSTLLVPGRRVKVAVAQGGGVPHAFIRAIPHAILVIQANAD